MVLEIINKKMNSINLVTIYFLTITYVVLGDVIVYRANTEQIIEEFHDLPAQFGPSVPSEGLKVLAVESSPQDGCTKIPSPPPPPPPQIAISEFSLPRPKWVLVIARNNCTFEEKIRNAQNAGYDAAIVFNIGSNDLDRMSAKNGEDIRIPSVFVGELSGRLIINGYLYDSGYKIFLKEDYPFNINTHLILPFAILVGLCFISMVAYMVYKCAREQRRLRRHRLPKRLLKKIPIVKFGKNQPYESCSICLDDYVEGEKLRVLPCAHAYHCQCIDPWLTKSRRICPLCKRKVFVRGEARNIRRRNTSSDSMSDSETDDTTPLLNPVENSNNHGTFSIGQRNMQGNHADERATSDEENVLTVGSSTRTSSNQQRINPFNRVPNLPPNLLDELNGRQSLWNRLFRFLRRPQHIPQQYDNSPATNLLPQQVVVSVAVNVDGNSSSRPSSNNILNTNLSGSFKDSDDDEQLSRNSIYEPISSPGENNTDSVFIETPTQGRLGVVALPNTNFNPLSGTSRRRNENDRNFIV